MRRGTLVLLFFIILLAAGASFVVFWPNTNGPYGVKNPFVITQGLDLQGGVSIQLVPKDPSKATADAMNTTRTLIEQRVSGGLGVKEPDVRVENVGTTPSIVVQLPKFSGNQETAIDTLLKTGTLEFWDTGTTGGLQDKQAFNPAQYAQYNPGGNALFNGNDLDPNGLSVGQDPQTGAYLINFAFKSGAQARFGSFTASHVGHYLTVTLDRVVVTSPVINGAITGNGQITGQFTETSAAQTVNLLKYGALPVALNKVSEETVGATLGQEAITKSLLAGGIGLGIVILYMLLYYRLPGLLADFALVLYAIITFAVYKLIGVTLSLAGIAGFILSIGMAVDANVLIFERVKEEIRAGRLLASAIDIGWRRAWPSIRDSNSSTIITCAILYIFGSNFGATIIVGFATTLFLGVLISLFTAIVVTRTFMNLLVPTGFINHPALFGLPSSAVPTVPVVTGAGRRAATVRGESRV